MPRELDYWQKLKLAAELEKGMAVSERHARTELIEKWVTKRHITLNHYTQPQTMKPMIGVAFKDKRWVEDGEVFPSEAMIAQLYLAFEFNKDKCAKCSDPIDPKIQMTTYLGDHICWNCIKSDPVMLDLYEKHQRNMHSVNMPLSPIAPHQMWKTKGP